MRVLFGCSMGGSGHLLPLVPIAQAFSKQGHDVVLFVPPSLADRALSFGLRVATGDQPPRTVVDQIWERVKHGPPEAVIGLIDRELFAGHGTDVMRDPAREMFREFEPDLVIREPCEYATAMTAHELGIPQVQIGISAAAIEANVLNMVAAELEARCAGVVDAIHTASYLTAFTALMDPSPWPDTRRYRVQAAAPSALPDWWPTMRDRPLIYVTFGSVLGGTSGALDVYRTALAAVADLPVRVLMTVGPAFGIDSLGPVPENTMVKPWVEQADVLATAELVVCHGGSGTTTGALAAGLPLVICPLFADQTANAHAVEQLGAGIVVTSELQPSGGVGTLTATDARALTSAVLSCMNTATYREAAQHVASQIAAVPRIDQIVAELTGMHRKI